MNLKYNEGFCFVNVSNSVRGKHYPTWQEVPETKYFLVNLRKRKESRHSSAKFTLFSSFSSLRLQYLLV
jgi:hypothetical protein